MAQQVIQGLESKVKLTSNIEMFDFFFCLAFVGFNVAFVYPYVHQDLQKIFLAFTVIFSIFLTVKSPINKKRRYFESAFLLLKRDKKVYMHYQGEEDR